ncbi:MAG: hypothetical protein O3C63_09180 [Cyanobacteria bacterium]|nr:hypothetical protein [Cyanobacteriota bacterium]
MRPLGNNKIGLVANNSEDQSRSSASSHDQTNAKRRLRNTASRLSANIREQRSDSFAQPNLRRATKKEIDLINKEIEKEGYPVPDPNLRRATQKEIDLIKKEIEKEGYLVPDPNLYLRRTTGEELAEFIDGNKEAGAYDIDGNGRTSPSSDGNLILLYSMGVRGDALKPFIDGDASVEDVEKKLEQSFKEGAFDVNNDGVSGYRDAQTILARLFSLPSSSLPGFIQGNNNTGPGVERFIDEHKAVGAYDIDGDGETNAATDGTLIFHYLQGQRGADLQPFIVGNTTVKEVEQRLQEAVERGSFDVDNDGMAGYSDGLSIYLRLAGYSGEEILERLEWDKGFIPGPDVGQRPIEDGFIPDPRLEPLPIDDGSYPVPDVRPRDPMIDIA